MISRARMQVTLVGALVLVGLSGCSLPPLHRSVAVETNRHGIPVHATGRMDNNRYTVARGDTLYSIAFRAHVDFHQLARWNGIRAPYVIHPGQVLRLSRPTNVAARPARPPVFETLPKSRPVAKTTPKTKPKPAPKPPVSVVKAPVSMATGAAGAAGVAVAGQPELSQPPDDQTAQAHIPADASRHVGGIRWRWPAAGQVLNQFNASDPIPGINIAGNRGDPVRAAADGVVVYSGNGLVGYGELVIIKHSDNYLSAYGHNSERLVKEGEHVKAGQLIARMGSTGASRNELEFQVRYKGRPVDPLKYLPQR